MKPLFAATALLLAASSFFSCNKKDEPATSSTLSVRMTDAPGDWESVKIDLKEVYVHLNDDSLNWVSLQANAGVYDLLLLQNGIDTLIAQGAYPGNTTVKEIRLVTGSNNSIQVNGQVYPLTIPSGAESGLKIKLNKRLQAPLESLLIDFDANLSIRQEADGYKLRPVLQLK